MPESTTDRRPERRTSERIRLSVTVEVRIPAHAAAPERTLRAELLDVARDGRGAAILVSPTQRVPLGGTVELQLPAGPIQGIVVSRLGLRGVNRLGLRVAEAGQGPLRAWAVPS